MLRDYDAHRPNEIFAELGTDWITLDGAYAVQCAVAELREVRGECRLGYKVGCRSPTIQNQLGLDQPVRGYLWQGACHPSGARLRASDFSNLAVEGEIAVRLISEIPVDFARSPLSELGKYIECWFPVIELHNYVFRGAKPTREELIAGNAMHAGFVAPSTIGNDALARSNSCSVEELSHVEIRIRIDRTLVEESNVSSLAGGPLGSVRWLVSSLALCNKALKSGDIVLTGSPGRLIPVHPGNAVHVACGRWVVELFLA